MTLLDKIKQRIWRFFYRFFPTFQRAFLRWGVIHHIESGRTYHVGWVARGVTLAQLKKHLHTEWGFGNNFVAWMEDGQVLSWRKLVSFQEQYHLRVFSDGEICGHLEFTPEAHPLKHLKEKGEREAKEDFLKFFGHYIVKRTHISHFKLNSSLPDTEPEVTFSL